MTDPAHDDFETILDGTSLHGWKMCGQGAFVLGDRMIVSRGGMGLLWYAKKTFRNFVLRVDWRTRRKCTAQYRSGFAPPSAFASNEPGEWNTFEIHAVGQNYAVILNNKRVTEFTGDRQLEGHIGLQNHDAESRVCFGKLAIREL